MQIIKNTILNNATNFTIIIITLIHIVTTETTFNVDDDDGDY